MPIDSNIPLQVRQQQPINPFGDIMQIMQLKQAQQLIPLKIQEAQQEAQKNALALQEQKRAISDREKYNAAYAAAIVPGPTGVPTTDRKKLSDAMIAAGIADKIPAALEGLDKVDKSAADLVEQKNKIRDANVEYGAGLGAAVKANNYNPDFYRHQVQTSLANGDTSPENAQKILSEMDQLDKQDPTGALSTQYTKNHADAMIAQSEKMTTSQARATTAATGQEKLPSEIERNKAETIVAQQRASGTVPITPYQQAELDKGGAERNPTEASLAMQVAKGKRPGASPEDVQASRDAETALKRLDQSKREARPSINVNMTPAQADTTADMIGQGKIDPTSVRTMLRRQPGLLAQVVAKYPGFDEADIDNRYNTAKEFSSSSNTKAGGQVLALNTLIHHADLYQQVGESLHNGTFVPGNAAYNAVASMFGSAPPQNANLVARFLAGETGKVATGGVPAEGEINGILQSLGQNASPEQIKQAGQKMLEIASGRMIPLKEKRDNAHLQNQFPIVGQDAAAILQKRGIDPNTLRPSAQPGGSGVKSVSSKAERDALPKGAQYTKPGDPTVYIKQ